jgi:hypothetical protein
VRERYRERLAGVLSCYDRIIITGTLPLIHADAALRCAFDKQSKDIKLYEAERMKSGSGRASPRRGLSDGAGVRPRSAGAGRSANKGECALR